MSNTTPQDEFLTTKGTSKKTGLTEGTLRYYRAIGCGPTSFKMGGRRVMYRRSEVDRWISEQEAASTRGGGQ